MSKIGNPLPIPKMSTADIARFWSKIVVKGEDECWPWIATKTHGYGHMSIHCPDGRNRHFGANRLAVYLADGKDPRHSLVLHTCDNRACCNRKHLYKGTQRENTLDQVNRGRHRGLFTMEAPIGEKNPRAKLLEQDVRTIRELCSLGYSQKTLRAAFDISKQSVSNIVLGKSWRHIMP